MEAGMRRTWFVLLAIVILVPLMATRTAGQAKPQPTLDIYFIDTEGAGHALRVALQQLDYVVISHYHGDHVGNATELANRLPIRTWYDHGAYTTENQPNRATGFLSWLPTRARVAVMNNGPRKGGEVGTWDIIHGLPNVDLWQLHYSVLVDKDHNPPENMVANMDDVNHNFAFKMSVRPDGGFTMTNGRTGFSKDYPAVRGAATTSSR